MEGKLQIGDAGLLVDHVVLRVRSLEESIGHYSVLLPIMGFKRIGEARWRNDAGFVVDLQRAEPGTGRYDRVAPGLNHLGFRAEDQAVLHRVRRELRSAGLEPPEIQHFPGAQSLFLPDPDGIRFEISFEEGS